MFNPPCHYPTRLLVHTYIYIYITGREIQGNIPLEIDRINLTEGRGDTEFENGIFPHIVRPEELQ